MEEIKQSIGKIVAIRDNVVEVEFLNLPRPSVYEVLYLERDPAFKFLVLASSTETRFYTVALASVKHISRGEVVLCTQSVLQIPVGQSLLGRLINVFGEPKDGLGVIDATEKRPLFSESPKYTEISMELGFLETGIKVIDLFAPITKGGKVGLFGGSGVGKTILLSEILNNIINKDKEKNVSIFCGVGERSREGQELYQELKETGVLPWVTLLFGHMGEPSPVRFLTAYGAIALAEYYRDVLQKNVLFFIDNVYRFAQAGNELSLLMNNIPSEDGYQATLYSEIAQIHERLNSKGSNYMTTVEAVYLPEDDIFDQAAQAVFSYLDSSIVLSREAYRQGRLPAIDILSSDSDVLNPYSVSFEHYNTAVTARSLLKKAELLERIVSLVGESELSEEDRIDYQRAKKITNYMTQNFFVAQNQTGKKGVFVPVDTTVKDVSAILAGNYDTVPEDKFLFIGSLEDIKK